MRAANTSLPRILPTHYICVTSPITEYSVPQTGPRSLRCSGSAAEMSAWEYIAPSTVIARGGSHPAVYRLYIDLRAVADSRAGDPVMLTAFLQVWREDKTRGLEGISLARSHS